MVPATQVVPIRFDVGIYHLVVEKLGVLRLPGYAPLIVVEASAENRNYPCWSSTSIVSCFK